MYNKIVTFERRAVRNYLADDSRSCHRNCLYPIYHFLLVVCSNHIHSVRDWLDLEKSFVFEKIVKITSYVRFLIYVKTIVDNAR